MVSGAEGSGRSALFHRKKSFFYEAGLYCVFLKKRFEQAVLIRGVSFYIESRVFFFNREGDLPKMLMRLLGSEMGSMKNSV